MPGPRGFWRSGLEQERLYLGAHTTHSFTMTPRHLCIFGCILRRVVAGGLCTLAALAAAQGHGPAERAGGCKVRLSPRSGCAVVEPDGTADGGSSASADRVAEGWRMAVAELPLADAEKFRSGSCGAVHNVQRRVCFVFRRQVACRSPAGSDLADRQPSFAVCAAAGAAGPQRAALDRAPVVVAVRRPAPWSWVCCALLLPPNAFILLSQSSACGEAPGRFAPA